MATKDTFLVIKYPKSGTAMEALGALEGLNKEKVIKLKDAAAITKNLKGKIKVHQTRDISGKKGFVKGGVIGVILAILFGPAGWIALGAASGALVGSLDKGIKNKILRELGQNMTPAESAVAILVQSSDWKQAVDRMKAHGFGGKVVVSEIVDADMAELEKLLADPKTEVPEKLEVVAAPVAAAAVVAAAEPAPAPVVEPEPEPAPVAKAATAKAAKDVVSGTRGMSVSDIEGIGPAYAEKLARIDIRTTTELLAQGAKPSGRNKIGKETAISAKLILVWVNKADLMRIDGVGPQYSDLLEAAGVDSPGELVGRSPAKLVVTFNEIVAAQPGIVQRVPTEAVVNGWIKAAKKLDKVVTH